MWAKSFLPTANASYNANATSCGRDFVTSLISLDSPRKWHVNDCKREFACPICNLEFSAEFLYPSLSLDNLKEIILWPLWKMDCSAVSNFNNAKQSGISGNHVNTQLYDDTPSNIIPLISVCLHLRCNIDLLFQYLNIFIPRIQHLPDLRLLFSLDEITNMQNFRHLQGSLVKSRFWGASF